MDSKGTYCVGGGCKSNTVDIIEYEKGNHQANKTVKVRKGKRNKYARSKSQVFC